jgi:D-alanyl-D-alanine carboxypeptidase
MKKLGKILIAGCLVASFSTTALFADYNKGYKYYNKFIKKKTKIKGTKFLKIIEAKTPEDIDALFKDNAKPLISLLEKKVKKKLPKLLKKSLKNTNLMI